MQFILIDVSIYTYVYLSIYTVFTYVSLIMIRSHHDAMYSDKFIYIYLYISIYIYTNRPS